MGFHLTQNKDTAAGQMDDSQQSSSKTYSFRDMFRARASELKRLTKANSQLQDQIYTLNEKIASMSRQNQQRESTMESMKAYLDTHDEVDVRTVTSYLVTINSMVEQLANEVALQWPAPGQQVKVDHNLDTYKHMKSILGSRLVRALDECDILDDASRPLFLYALQSTVTYRVYELFQIRTFRTGEHPVDQLSKQIRDGEIQPVYGRWRSVAQRYLRKTGVSGSEADIMNRFSHDVSIDMLRVAQIYGFGLSNEAYAKTTQDLQSSLMEVAKKTIQLSTIVTVDIISRDYELYYPNTGDFDPRTMEAAFPLPKQAQNDKILSVLSLGFTAVGKPDRQQVKLEQNCVQNAVVLTEAALAEIITPATKRSKGRQ